MKKFLSLALTLTALSFTFTACTKKEHTEAPAEGKVGVAECDEYIEKVQKCLTDKVPAEQRSMIEGSFKQTVEQWKTLTTPEQKASLGAACKSALDAAKSSYQAFGCEL